MQQSTLVISVGVSVIKYTIFSGLMIGCFAAKLPGQISASILSENVLDYLICNLDLEDTHPQVTLFTIIALEKLAQTGENKRLIMSHLREYDETNHPLLRLERWSFKDNSTRRQVQFCAQWTLDNIFVKTDRRFSYETVDGNEEVNAMLSQTDISEYLKLSPDGLVARNDSNSFESVRCTFQVDSGVWYYEVTVVTPGVMQIGWATKNSKFLNHDGFGIGDDEYSIAYDGYVAYTGFAFQTSCSDLDFVVGFLNFIFPTFFQLQTPFQFTSRFRFSRLLFQTFFEFHK